MTPEQRARLESLSRNVNVFDGENIEAALARIDELEKERDAHASERRKEWAQAMDHIAAMQAVVDAARSALNMVHVHTDGTPEPNIVTKHVGVAFSLISEALAALDAAKAK